MNYTEFLARKEARAHEDGIHASATEVNPILHDWQSEIVRWALRTGRAAIWADTGLGKTMMQIEWARLVTENTNGAALIIAPLAVCEQTIREGRRIGVDIQFTRETPNGSGLWITNYEMVDKIDTDMIDAIVLDEASILKSSDGKMRTLLIAKSESVPHRLACTATPAPNDPEELTNYAEFLGHMSRTHMLAAYYVHDDQGWRLKGHAKRPMYRWMATWAIAIRFPSDMGGDDTGYRLPGLDIIPEMVHVDLGESDDHLFVAELGGVTGRAQVRRETLPARVARAAELVAAEPDEPWLLWCGLNAESDALAKAIPDAINVHGSLTPEQKADALLGFADGNHRVLITKPSIASQGLNYQHCARMIFVGLSDSYEQYYQAIRRCYRYGQQRIVRAHIVLSELEHQIAANVARKEREAKDVTSSLVAEMTTARKETAA